MRCTVDIRLYRGPLRPYYLGMSNDANTNNNEHRATIPCPAGPITTVTRYSDKASEANPFGRGDDVTPTIPCRPMTEWEILEAEREAQAEVDADIKDML